MSDTITLTPSRTDDECLLLCQDGKYIKVPWEDIPRLIPALRRAYNTRPGQQSQADGVVASVLLQSAVAEAPGDFG
jgi:hypothetical protein